MYYGEWIIFLSTLPARGATVDVPRHCVDDRCISIHAPREGSDGAVDRRDLILHRHFYPRSPRGERPVHPGLCRRLCPISIHAPREGSDSRPDKGPLREYISIHAPREGSDRR